MIVITLQICRKHGTRRFAITISRAYVYLELETQILVWYALGIRDWHWPFTFKHNTKVNLTCLDILINYRIDFNPIFFLNKPFHNHICLHCQGVKIGEKQTLKSKLQSSVKKNKNTFLYLIFCFSILFNVSPFPFFCHPFIFSVL